jgi:hypothetical protein
MDEKPKRHWFRFSLRTLFVLVAAIAICLGWIARDVVQRKRLLSWVEENGGYVDLWHKPEPFVIDTGGIRIIKEDYQRVLGPEEEPAIPRWREWLGDVAVNRVLLPKGSTETDLERAKAMFREADVEILPEAVPGFGF